MDKPHEIAANVSRSPVPSYASNDTGAPGLLTDKQRAFIESLLAERNVDTSVKSLDEIRAMIPTLTRQQASAWIESLMDAPKKVGLPAQGYATPHTTPVPAGRYALRAGDAHRDSVLFYKVDRPTEGRWSGFVFVNRQASDELYPVKNKKERDIILRAIAEMGIQESMELYGRELGHCGHCGRTLTNDESRARGIGPVCAERMGW